MRVAVAFVVLFAVAAAAQNLQPAPAPAAPTPAPAPAAPAAAPAPAAPAPATNTSLPPVIPRMPGYYNPCAAPPCPSTKPMKIATVLGRRGCGCMEQPVCECRPQQFVNPELKPNPADINNAICGCLTEAICPCRPRQLIEAVDVKSFSSNSACGCVGQVSCPCSSGSSSVSYVPAVTSQDSSMGSRVVLTQDACGCLQLAVCPCRKTYVQPELKQSSSPCGCIAEPVCGCRQTAYVAPEVKSSCPCEFQNVDPCACRSSFSSNSGSFGSVKPFYSN